MDKTFELWDNDNKVVVSVKTKRAGKEWNCLCPFHDDKTPSMFINEEKEVYICYGACGKSGKLYDPDYKKEGGKFVINKTYNYRDKDGNMVFQTAKQFTPKDFRQRRPDGKGGWIWNLDGIEPIPYNLPDIVSSDKNIVIVEGEKDADNLKALGFCATTTRGGANKKWSEELNKYFKNRNVAIIMDNDDLDSISGYRVGEKHAHEIAENLHEIAKTVTVISLPGLKDKEDVSDWLNKGGTRDELIKIMQAKPLWKPADKPKKAKIKSKIKEPNKEALKNIPFKFLGYNYGSFYYLPNRAIQVVQLSKESHKKNSLMTLAPLNWWEKAFPTDAGSCHWDSAVNWCYRMSEDAGTFDQTLIRGCGAWYDDDRVVVHLGNKLYVDGEIMKIDKLDTKFIYEVANPANIDFDNPLNDKEARKFLEIAKQLPWENPMSAYLFAGWCISAIICGALDWRPHIWITGSMGTGKTFIMDDIVGELLDNQSLKVKSNTTEPGIRQGLKNNAFPILFDEAENKQVFNQERMAKIIEIMRHSSSKSGAVVLKGSSSGHVVEYRIRSSFCMASILAKIEDKADESRICVLHLKKIIPPSAGIKMFNEFKKTVAHTFTKKYFSGMRARAISLIPTIRQNIPSFALYFSEQNGQRYGDQFGTLLSCAHTLHRSGLITEPKAREWIIARNWDEQMEGSEKTEENDCLQSILQHTIRFDIGDDRLIIELLYAALGKDTHYGADSLDKSKEMLARNGLKIDDDYFYVSDSHLGIKAILSKTPWNAKWRDILRRLPDALIKSSSRFGHLTHRATAIPIELVFTDEIKFGMEKAKDNEAD